MNKLFNKLFSAVLVTFCLPLFIAGNALALPEDASKQLDVASSYNDAFLDQGIFVYYGTEEVPAKITQGTMEITGMEIRVELVDNKLDKATAIGNPASFQQQLVADQEPIHASGLTLVFDNKTQLLTIDEEAQLQQGGTKTDAYHFEFDLQTRRIRATQNPNGEQVRMVIPPSTPQ